MILAPDHEDEPEAVPNMLSRSRRRPETWISVALVGATAAYAGGGIWVRWSTFMRVLLTAYVLGLVVFLTEDVVSTSSTERIDADRYIDLDAGREITVGPQSERTGSIGVST